MIAYLKGTILKKTEKGIILNTGNVGYFVHVTVTLLANLLALNQPTNIKQNLDTTKSKLNQNSENSQKTPDHQFSTNKNSNHQDQHQIELFIHSNIREDAFDLYGFTTYSDLIFFKTLISVSGIGPKSALEILNNDTNKIKAAILNEDSEYLCKIPGIGQKTAKRLILELKNKIEIDDISSLENSSNLGKSSSNFEPHPDAIDALVRLGYQRHQVTKTLRNIPTEITAAEEVITYFLKNI